MKNNKILLYGGLSTSYLVYENLKSQNKKVDFIFDEFIKKANYKSKAKFSNKKTDLKNFIKQSKYFFVCIGMYDGFLRDYISKIFIKKNLTPLSIISKHSIVDKNTTIGHGLLCLPNSVIHKKVKIGNNCLLNVNSVIDHECIIGDGVHVMGSAYIAGRVKIGNFSSIGANATVLPDLKIGKNSIIGAGAVVTKDVKDGQVVVGNPAKFLRLNKKKYNLEII
ncbi:NeuD/PglB/VioB family sugar acetyltransferase [Candidatus Pelagibacter ubique]|uniref:NeuD/PglB/VioB family sugar acetyltransferase n=1 Tax=Pelagibacter ubique TaxID=198252 RepID=UPI0003C7FEB0